MSVGRTIRSKRQVALNFYDKWPVNADIQIVIDLKVVLLIRSTQPLVFQDHDTYVLKTHV